MELAQPGGRAVPERPRARSRRGRGGVGGGAGWGRLGPGGAGGDVVCWAESGSKPNGLCRFGVKNARGVSFSGEKRGGCGENIRGCGEKVENSGEKCKFAGEKKMYHSTRASRSCDRRVGTHFAPRPKVAAALNQNV